MAGSGRNEAYRRLVVVSGYYGFSNLGDEAILEELSGELKRLVEPEDIVVLSAAPEETARLYGVAAADRWSLPQLAALLRRARLFVSGGGGLFQDTRSAGSAVYYAGQILLARLLAVPAVVYAQGLGPLRGRLAGAATALALKSCQEVTLRDQASQALACRWGVEALLTADPVWSLAPSRLPPALSEQLSARRRQASLMIGLSLRPAAVFNAGHRQALVQAMAQALPDNALVVLLPLQGETDAGELSRFAALWQASGRQALLPDLSGLTVPSQWLSLLGHMDLTVSMRLHAAIMSLAQAVPVVGIPYDPKVSQLLADSGQPVLNLANEAPAALWTGVLKAALAARDDLAGRAAQQAEAAKNLACQNFNVLARILGMQRDPRA